MLGLSTPQTAVLQNVDEADAEGNEHRQDRAVLNPLLEYHKKDDPSNPLSARRKRPAITGAARF